MDIDETDLKNVLEQKKEQLKDDLEDIKLKSKGFKNGKKSLEQLVKYFED